MNRKKREKDVAKEAGEQIVLNMIETSEFRMQGTFRVWISTKPISELPISLLQDCNKTIFEPVNGVKLNTIKTLNSTPPDYMRACEERLIPFRQLYFAISLFHAIINERDNYLSLGWSRPYEFSQADHKIGALQLLSLMKETARKNEQVPLRLLNYVIAQINYGGKISNL